MIREVTEVPELQSRSFLLMRVGVYSGAPYGTGIGDDGGRILQTEEQGDD